MHQVSTIFKIIGLISFLTGSLMLGSLYSDSIRLTPMPSATISGSLG
jgi:hypothetical protein